jgi:hypothetical protein
MVVYVYGDCEGGVRGCLATSRYAGLGGVVGVSGDVWIRGVGGVAGVSGDN